MKKLLALILASSLSLAAQAATEPGEPSGYGIRPGLRKSVDVLDNMPNPFQHGPAIKTQERLDDRGEVIPEPDGLRLLEVYLKQNPPAALAWSDEPEQRSVIIGDSVMRTGSSFSAEVLEHGDGFYVSEISRDRVLFVSSKNPAYRVEAPITLRERLKSIPPRKKKQ